MEPSCYPPSVPRIYPSDEAEAQDLILRIEAAARVCGITAHFLNNQLTAMVGYSSLLADAKLEEIQSDHVRRLRGAAERAIRMTGLMHGLARQQVSLDRDLDLNHVAAGLEPTLRKVLGADRDLTVAVAKDPLPMRCDRAEFEQILFSLVTNILEHTPSRVAVRMETGAARDQVHLTLSDDGPGIPAADLPDRLLPFSTTKADRCAGIGLTTAALWLHRRGGRLVLRSDAGEGLAVSVLLPRSAGG